MIDHEYLRHWAMKPNSLILDLGATVGEFTREYLPQIKATGSMVINMEPAYWNLKHLIPFVEEQAKENAVILSAAISDHNGFVEFVTTDSSVLHHNASVVQHWQHREVYKTKMPCLTLDTIIDIVGAIDFVKCDIEGAELEAFLSCSKLDKVKNACVAAYHIVNGEPTWKRLVPFFELNGFDVIHNPSAPGEESGIIYLRR